MIYLTATGLIIAGIVIIVFMILMEQEANSQKNHKELDLPVFLELFSILLGFSNVLLPLGLIFLGILLIFYH